mmetsp:Transcript_10900/g.23256  ORF Transcript_10900/g.23256 Transcript_10900/m.23256 type:complete len:267 (-) Transcript_10900:2112-2912(-)|eukprot:2743747-Pleurochrysis_carterae.AAC.1
MVPLRRRARDQGEGEGGGRGPVWRHRPPAAPRPHAAVEDAQDLQRLHAGLCARVGHPRDQRRRERRGHLAASAPHPREGAGGEDAQEEGAARGAPLHGGARRHQRRLARRDWLRALLRPRFAREGGLAPHQEGAHAAAAQAGDLAAHRRHTVAAAALDVGQAAEPHLPARPASPARLRRPLAHDGRQGGHDSAGKRQVPGGAAPLLGGRRPAAGRPAAARRARARRRGVAAAAAWPAAALPQVLRAADRDALLRRHARGIARAHAH